VTLQQLEVASLRNHYLRAFDVGTYLLENLGLHVSGEGVVFFSDDE